MLSIEKSLLKRGYNKFKSDLTVDYNNHCISSIDNIFYIYIKNQTKIYVGLGEVGSPPTLLNNIFYERRKMSGGRHLVCVGDSKIIQHGLSKFSNDDIINALESNKPLFVDR